MNPEDIRVLKIKNNEWYSECDLGIFLKGLGYPLKHAEKYITISFSNEDEEEDYILKEEIIDALKYQINKFHNYKEAKNLLAFLEK